jgi:hypothetical protein
MNLVMIKLARGADDTDASPERNIP